MIFVSKQRFTFSNVVNNWISTFDFCVRLKLHTVWILHLCVTCSLTVRYKLPSAHVNIIITGNLFFTTNVQPLIKPDFTHNIDIMFIIQKHTSLMHSKCGANWATVSPDFYRSFSTLCKYDFQGYSIGVQLWIKTRLPGVPVYIPNMHNNRFEQVTGGCAHNTRQTPKSAQEITLPILHLSTSSTIHFLAKTTVCHTQFAPTEKFFSG